MLVVSQMSYHFLLYYFLKFLFIYLAALVLRRGILDL